MSRKNLLVICIILLGVLTISLGVAFPIPMAHAQVNPKIFYVRSYYTAPTVAAANDGLSWEDAFEDLQPALEAAEGALETEERVEIWVAAGTYLPTSANDLTDPNMNLDRLNNFKLLNNVAIYGGFPKNGGSWDKRDWVTNVTTLSGGKNSYHVFYNLGLNNTAILDGFTVTAGNANDTGGIHIFGGGFCNYDSSPVIRNVKITGNNARMGGGMYNEAGIPELTNVTFETNTATANGGGMYNDGSYPILNNVTFTDNHAVVDGGGVFNLNPSETGELKVMNGNSTIEFADVTFTGNAASHGGGMYSHYTNLSLHNVIFSKNEAKIEGGGMYSLNGYCLLSDVEFIDNKADIAGGGILTESYDPEISVPPIEFSDVVFSGNTAYFGGGMLNRKGVISLNRVEFIANNANCGGAIANNGYLDVNRAKFIGNNAKVDENVSGPGGGIWHHAGNLNLVNAIFSCNSAYTGGGIFSNGDFSLVNATFSGNHAQIGGAMYCQKMVYDGTHSANSSEDEISSANVINCIFWANTAEDGPQIKAERDLQISHSLIQGAFSPDWDDLLGTNAGGNIDAGPLFIRNPDSSGETPDYGDLRLRASSPARDKGTNVPYQTGITKGITLDLDGKSRISNARVDMGAYEYQYTPSPPPDTPPETPRLERLGGKDRFETAVEISKAGWKQSDTVILARNDVYADALAGVPLAYLHNAPLLLTQKDSLPLVVKNEINRLGAKKVIILGGNNAVSRKVQQELVAMNLTVQRIGARNRFGTAAAIADLVAPNGKEQVALANGHDFPDALTLAAYAAYRGMPILLTDRDNLPEETSAAITKLNVNQTIVVGGREVISEAALARIGAYLRIAGEDRYGTAIALANHFAPSADRIFIATGLEFADSLTGAALAAKEGCGILLVNQPIPDQVSAFLAGKNVTLFTVFGGRAAVSQEIADQLIK